MSNPAENTTGPITRSESAGDISVSATGRLERIEWTLAEDGEVFQSVVCSGDNAAGTPSELRFDDKPSPMCGFDAMENDRSVTVTVTGTVYRIVEWTGGGQLGTIEFRRRAARLRSRSARRRCSSSDAAPGSGDGEVSPWVFLATLRRVTPVLEVRKAETIMCVVRAGGRRGSVA